MSYASIERYPNGKIRLITHDRYKWTDDGRWYQKGHWQPCKCEACQDVLKDEAVVMITKLPKGVVP